MDKFSSPFSSFDFLTISYWWQLPVGRWLYDNPHTQYRLHIDIEKRRRRRCVYDWRGFKIYDWRRRLSLSHTQMTDSDFTLWLAAAAWWRRSPSLRWTAVGSRRTLTPEWLTFSYLITRGLGPRSVEIHFMLSFAIATFGKVFDYRIVSFKLIY